MKASPFYLLAALALGLSSCDSSPAGTRNEAPKAGETAAPPAALPAATPEATRIVGHTPAAANAPTAAPAPARAQASKVAMPAGLKVGRWQAFLLAQQHAVHFVLEVTVEGNKAVGYLVNEGPNGPQRLRCAPAQAAGDSAIIGLLGTDATLVVRANGADHLTGAWVDKGQKKATRTAFSAVYGERSPLRSDATTSNFAGSWCASFKGRNGRTYPAIVVFEQQGAKLLGSISSAGSAQRCLSGAALATGMGISSFDGGQAILLQARKLPNGKLEGDFYSGNAVHETWTAVNAKYADCPGYPDSPRP